MEQRSLRLGDVIDDYCPRDRRVTNHVIVVVDGDAILQTRCNTCDIEHDYKEAKVPRKKLKNGESSDLAGGILVPHKPAAVNGSTDGPQPAPMSAAPVSTDPPSPSATDSEPNGEAETMPDGWLAHRPLIRASLPKIDGEVPPPRAIPEFTMHQRQPRGGFAGRGFRHGGGGGHGFAGHNGGRMPPMRDTGGNDPDGNRVPGQGGGGGATGAGPGAGKSRHRRRRRR
jgi:hypothetical protein